MFILCKSEGWRNAGPGELARGGCLCHAHAEAQLGVRDALPRGAGLQRAARLRSAGARRGGTPLVSQFEGAEKVVRLLCPFPQLLGINWRLCPLEAPGVSHPQGSAQEGSGPGVVGSCRGWMGSAAMCRRRRAMGNTGSIREPCMGGNQNFAPVWGQSPSCSHRTSPAAA